MRISIAEDNIHMRNIIRKMIENHFPVSIAVSEFGNGYDLIAALPSSPPDLVIMDIRMKKMDGLTALREIKMCRPELPVLLITQFETEEYSESASELGAAALINKSELHSLIEFITRFYSRENREKLI
ncbi:MAG: response regulator transcription factor [Ignavibacteriaceae bacterium]|nr:response regulator transcription factor [Ignavibacteriaceae bacterium]